MRRLVRPLLAIGLGCVTLATSCGTHTGLALGPSPAAASDSLAMWEGALAVAADVAARHVLVRDPKPPSEQSGTPEAWTCFAKPGAGFCLRSAGGAIQFHVGNAGRGLSDTSDSIRAELAAALSARFGAQAVRACTWQSVPDSARARWWRTARRLDCV